jgi:hypothetical protein
MSQCRQLWELPRSAQSPEKGQYGLTICFFQRGAQWKIADIGGYGGPFLYVILSRNGRLQQTGGRIAVYFRKAFSILI